MCNIVVLPEMNTIDSSKIGRVWLTDGSPARFSDVHQLRATHRSILGIRTPYKGLVDPAVPIGSAIIEAERADDVIIPEAEWTVLFPDGIRRYLEAPDHVDHATPVLMQGLIEGKWLNRLLGTRAWGPASMGNNLLADGPGIPATLGQIEAGARGEIQITYQYQHAGQTRTQVQRTTLADLRGQNILGLVRDVLRFCQETEQEIDAIDLSAMGPEAALVTDRRRLWASMRFARVPLPNPQYLFPLHRLGERIVQSILAEGLTVPPDTAISIVTRDPHGTVVGQGKLSWQAG